MSIFINLIQLYISDSESQVELELELKLELEVDLESTTILRQNKK